ncbi:phospholipase D1 [Nephila pilipes]|uniref:Phospholipase n=1 Tax=Nephila pilipes TaxID=299642 RepID=A0A8X6NHA2_NEPPI|nr:phospholipase D1 [Nephila pilipes]
MILPKAALWNNMCNYSIKPPEYKTSLLRIGTPKHVYPKLFRVSLKNNLLFQLEFLEIGPLSFVEDFGLKGKEGFVSRKYNEMDSSLRLCGRICEFEMWPFWKKRQWTVNTILCHIINCFIPRGIPMCVETIGNSLQNQGWLFIKENFAAFIEPRSGRVEHVILFDRGFRVDTHKYKARVLIQNLSRHMHVKCESEEQAQLWMEEFNFVLDNGSKDFVTLNRYGSFAPPRPLTECRWIVDGATYFEAVAEVLDKATEEIYIADWWLSPEIYMKRPTVHGHYWQLDYILKRKARAGVRIYVLLYKELELALGINSHHSEKKLRKMHKNIKVIRHPEVSKGVLLWAHHEKIVCVDQTYAFVGGLDLCYGRWDDYQHKLSDFGDVEKKIKVLRHMAITPRRDSTMKFATETRSSNSVPDLSSDVEMSHQILEKFEPVEKKTVFFRTAIRKYQATHTFERIKKRLSIEAAMDASDNEKAFAYLQPADRRRTIQEMALLVLGMNRKFRLWHGKDYANFINKDILQLHQPYSVIDKFGKKNLNLSEVCPKDSSCPYLMPKAYASMGDNMPSILSDTIGTIFRAECQNQFFITQPSGEKNVFNGIADTLYHRILKAYREKAPYHVYVVVPLLPAFEGELGTGSGTCMQAVMYWNYKSICRGPTSLHQRLSKIIKDPSMYISFCGLRAYGTLLHELVTELVYVHSKLLIADDQVAIIGSANINDRSLLGRRDSEIAVVIKDTHFLDKEDGRPHEAGKFCSSLRHAIFREHLGLMACPGSDMKLRDPSSKQFFENIWLKTAIENTKIYEEVFHCIPSDKVQSFRDLKNQQLIPPLATSNPEEARKKLRDIRGYLVAFPYFFLCNEKLALTLSTKERYLPISVWT